MPYGEENDEKGIISYNFLKNSYLDFCPAPVFWFNYFRVSDILSPLKNWGGGGWGMGAVPNFEHFHNLGFNFWIRPCHRIISGNEMKFRQSGGGGAGV